MVEPRQSALQRIQVGLVGLVVVLLFVSLANMVLDRVTGEASVAASSSGDPQATPDEPLAELGVTPVASEEVAPVAGSPTPAGNASQVPAGQRR